MAYSNDAKAGGDIQPAHDPSVDDQLDRDDIARTKTADRIISDARLATEKEQRMTLLEGVRLYPKAIMWSMLISTCIVMEGYDVCLINNFCWYPPSLYYLCPADRTGVTKTHSRSSTASMASSYPTETGKSPPLGSRG